MGKSKRNSRVENKQRKPLSAAKAQVSAPETTVTAQYRSAIGIDVHLNLLVCTYQTQLDDHREIRESRDFLTDRKSLEEFTTWCCEKKPEVILMESTGVLWYSPYEALEDAGFSNAQLALINARRQGSCRSQNRPQGCFPVVGSRSFRTFQQVLRATKGLPPDAISGS